ncbi:hypothetical protein [Actinomadura decatromicini]|nr:hypothetical protein [Actinomadura decatromicini]
MVKLPTMRKRVCGKASWSVEAAHAFLESAQSGSDPRYAAWVLIFVMGLRKGEVLSLQREDIDMDAGE